MSIGDQDQYYEKNGVVCDKIRGYGFTFHATDINSFPGSPPPISPMAPITRHDFFAGMALQGLIAIGAGVGRLIQDQRADRVAIAKEYADLMIRATSGQE